MHEALEKFGYSDNCLHETEHWCVVLRLSQATLGSMLLAYKGVDAQSLVAIPPKHFAELSGICGTIEGALVLEFGPERFNYLALIMVDHYVHFHVIARFDSAVSFGGETIVDENWPGLPDLARPFRVFPVIFDRSRNCLACAIFDQYA